MPNAKTDKARLFKGVFIGVQVDLTSKPVFEDIVDLLEEKGVEDASTVAVGSLVKLWCYIQQHGERGRIKCSPQKLCRRTKIRRDVGELIMSSEWFSQEDGVIEIVDWEKKFFDGSADRLAVEREQGRKRQQAFRDSHKQGGENVTERNGNVTERNALRNGAVTEGVPLRNGAVTEGVPLRNGAVTPIDRYIEEEEYKEVEVDRDGTATKLDLFLKRLGKAGLHVGHPPEWLYAAMSNGHSDTYLQAAEELQYTKFMESDKPTSIDNFKEKNFGWVEQLASGKWSKGGPPPQAASIDPMEEWVTVPAAGKRMKRKDAKAWMADPANAEYVELYNKRSQRNINRDTHRGDTPPADAPIPQAIPRPVLKNADEDFDTEAAKEKALTALAAHIEK